MLLRLRVLLRLQPALRLLPPPLLLLLLLVLALLLLLPVPRWAALQPLPVAPL